MPLMPEVIGEDVIGDQYQLSPARRRPARAGSRRGAGDRAFADLGQQAEGSPARPSSAVVASWSERMPTAA